MFRIAGRSAFDRRAVCSWELPKSDTEKIEFVFSTAVLVVLFSVVRIPIQWSWRFDRRRLRHDRSSVLRFLGRSHGTGYLDLPVDWVRVFVNEYLSGLGRVFIFPWAVRVEAIDSVFNWGFGSALRGISLGLAMGTFFGGRMNNIGYVEINCTRGIVSRGNCSLRQCGLLRS